IDNLKIFKIIHNFRKANVGADLYAGYLIFIGEMVFHPHSFPKELTTIMDKDALGKVTGSSTFSWIWGKELHEELSEAVHVTISSCG
ncbi:hypothetical protein GIB67_031169, partial [Kingdonia uniflora]